MLQLRERNDWSPQALGHRAPNASPPFLEHLSMKREQGVKISLNHKSTYLRAECMCSAGGRGEERSEGERECVHMCGKEEPHQYLPWWGFVLWEGRLGMMWAPARQKQQHKYHKVGLMGSGVTMGREWGMLGIRNRTSPYWSACLSAVSVSLPASIYLILCVYLLVYLSLLALSPTLPSIPSLCCYCHHPDGAVCHLILVRPLALPLPSLYPPFPSTFSTLITWDLICHVCLLQSSRHQSQKK